MASSLHSTVLVFVLVGVLQVHARSVVRRSGHGHWSYGGETGPDHWASIDPTCGGQSQSPINIDLATASPEDFDRLSYTLHGGRFNIHNNGHSVQVDITGGKNEFCGAGLPGEKYKLVQFHWHWGSANSQGSEHTVDGVQYAAENHFVLYDMKYADFNEAKTQVDGVAVIGALITVDTGDQDNSAYAPIVDALSKVTNPEDESNLKQISVRSLLPDDLSDFARYRGSLTTPSCLETVVWTVMLNPVKISQSQIDAFRSLLTSEGHPLVDNFRPTQPLNERVVQKTN